MHGPEERDPETEHRRKENAARAGRRRLGRASSLGPGPLRPVHGIARVLCQKSTVTSPDERAGIGSEKRRDAHRPARVGVARDLEHETGFEPAAPTLAREEEPEEDQ